MLARQVTLGVLAVMVGGAWGCGATGLAWVHEPESGVDLGPPPASVPRAGSFRSDPPELAAATVAAPQSQASRRLDRTITLGGEGTAVAALPSEGTTDARSSTTIVNVYVGSPASTPAYYGTFGPSFATAVPSFGVARTVAVQGMAPSLRPGLDWPAVPNHGSSFPYRTAPASPWDGDGSRRR